MQRGRDLYLDLIREFPDVHITAILDVGANVGQSAHGFDANYPQAKIYCFEPVEAAFRQLVANTKDYSRVHPHRTAMGATTGVAVIHVAQESSLSSLVIASIDAVDEHVPMTSVDTFCTDNGIDSISILKIDAEGYDTVVLAGAERMLRERRVAVVQVETSLIERCSPRFVPLRMFVETLAPFKYELFAIYDQMPYLDGRQSLEYCNAVFVSPDLLRGEQ